MAKQGWSNNLSIEGVLNIIIERNFQRENILTENGYSSRTEQHERTDPCATTRGKKNSHDGG
jgi:hypothetical protein